MPPFAEHNNTKYIHCIEHVCAISKCLDISLRFFLLYALVHCKTFEGCKLVKLYLKYSHSVHRHPTHQFVNLLEILSMEVKCLFEENEILHGPVVWGWCKIRKVSQGLVNIVSMPVQQSKRLKHQQQIRG